MSAAPRTLRIAQVAPPLERVPPSAYGGTERIVHELTTELVARGHDVTVFASGDSDVPARLIPTVETALRPAGIESDSGGWFATTVKAVLEHPDVPWTIIHNGLTLDGAPFREKQGEAFCFVGRVDPEKGVLEAMEIARRA